MQNRHKSQCFNEIAQRRRNNPRFYNFMNDYDLSSPDQEDIKEIAQLITNSLNSLASPNQFFALLHHNNDILKCIRKRDETQDCTTPGAFLALLPLNELGLAALANGTLNVSNPSVDLIAEQGQPPAALYVWGLYAPGEYIKSVTKVDDFITTGIYRNCPKYARAKDAKSERMLKRLGWHSGTMTRSMRAKGILCHPFNTTTEISAHQALSARVVNSQEDILKIFSIRAATYIAEQGCPYNEEFDGNDYCSSHILGFVDKEPVACIRIRYFSEFVKLERLAVRKEFRGTGIAGLTIKTALQYAKKKGFTRFYGHSRTDLVQFWERFGFNQIEGRPPLTFSNQDYVEIFYQSDEHPDPISLSDGPYVLIRPEGAWERPGILDPRHPSLSTKHQMLPTTSLASRALSNHKETEKCT